MSYQCYPTFKAPKLRHFKVCGAHPCVQLQWFHRILPWKAGGPQPLLEEVIDGIMPGVIEEIGIQLLAKGVWWVCQVSKPWKWWWTSLLRTNTSCRSIFAKHCKHTYVTSTEIILNQSIAGLGIRALWPLNSKNSNQGKSQRKHCLSCS